MGKVYLVTSGSYSDYSIHRIFSIREKAENYRKFIHNANGIEEFELDDDKEIDYLYELQICKFGTGNIYKLSVDRNTLDTSNRESSVHISFDRKDNPNVIIKKFFIKKLTEKEEEDQFNKCKKILQDVLGEIAAYKSEGFTNKQIEEIYKEKYAKGNNL